ncbi:MAG: CDP-alcohol phosphatidyltransferase family protein [Desulfobacteraceae bacterium]
MERAAYILTAIALSSAMYGAIAFLLKKRGVREFAASRTYLHPNAICGWRVLIGALGMILYFIAGAHFTGILLFAVSAFLDGVDGLVARECGLVTSFGEEIDPLCDKLTYLPPMGFFAYQGLLPVGAFWVLIVIEASGQFLVRYILKRFTRISLQANNFGKIKAVLCFALIIYLAILDDVTLGIPDFTTQLLHLCIIMSLASIVFKAIPNRFYADILSILNLLCGIAGIWLVLDGLYVHAALAVLAGQVFDLFDGRMAEKHGGTRFGPWLDDIADLTSFGLCPSLLIMSLGGPEAHALLLSALYFSAVGFRLWRYLRQDKGDSSLPPGTFNGLPSPAGALVALGTCLLLGYVWVSWLIICLTCYLLISHVRFVHFARVILPLIPRPLVITMGFMILFAAAYLIKARDTEMLGGVLLGVFLLYVFAGNYRILGRYLKA